MMVWKMIFLFQGCLVRFHVNLPGCMFWICWYVVSLQTSGRCSTRELQGLPSFAGHWVAWGIFGPAERRLGISYHHGLKWSWSLEMTWRSGIFRLWMYRDISRQILYYVCLGEGLQLCCFYLLLAEECEHGLVHYLCRYRHWHLLAMIGEFPLLWGSTKMPNFKWFGLILGMSEWENTHRHEKGVWKKSRNLGFCWLVEYVLLVFVHVYPSTPMPSRHRCRGSFLPLDKNADGLLSASDLGIEGSQTKGKRLKGDIRRSKSCPMDRL